VPVRVYWIFLHCGQWQALAAFLFVLKGKVSKRKTGIYAGKSILGFPSLRPMASVGRFSFCVKKKSKQKKNRNLCR
jgi:hypothetical protein